MRNKKVVTITLALAGIISVGGAAGLHANMNRKMNEKHVAQVERKHETKRDMSKEEANQEETNQTETNQTETVNQVWYEDESIYLPEGAEIISNDEYGCGIAWDNCNISYMHYSKETQEDLGLGKLKPIVEDAIKKYSGQELGECDMQIFIEDPINVESETQDIDVENVIGTDIPDIDIDSLDTDAINADLEDDGVAVIETADDEVVIENADGTVTITSFEAEPISDEVRDIYYLDYKCYQVHILTESQRYDLWIDSVTGQVTVFNHEDETLGTFTNGWDIMDAADVEHELPAEEQKEFDDIIKTFVADDLKLGNVEKIYAQYMGVTYVGTSGNNIRAYYNVICKTVDGAVVEVTFDIGEKKVTSFRTSTHYLSK